MIFYLATEAHLYTTDVFLETLGRELAGRIRPLSYERAARMASLPAGSYIFADLDRLVPARTRQAAALWRALRENRPGCRLLNDPIRCLRRYELLRRLHLAGINDFNAYRLTEGARSFRFPVFLRGEADHDGPLTPLLHSDDELQAAIEKLAAEGDSREDKLIIEFRDVSDGDGVYHRYGAIIIGTEILPGEAYFSRDWVVKGTSTDCHGADFRAASRRYTETNPWAQAVRPIFEMAQIEYGRMDFAVTDGRVQVFEINTNPVLLLAGDLDDPERRPTVARYAGNLVRAFRELDAVAASGRRIPVRAGGPVADRPWTARLRLMLQGALRGLGLGRLERPVIGVLRRAKRRYIGRG